MHLYFINYTSQLFIDQLDALQWGRLKSVDLLFAKNFKSNFRNKQVWSQTTSVSNGCLDIVICQCIERINRWNSCGVDFVEDVIKSAAAFEFGGGVFDEATFQKFSIRSSVFSDYI